MIRADSKHKPSRQIFKGIHKKAAEIRNFLPNFAVPEPWKEERGTGGRAIPAGAALASRHSSFTPRGTARPQLLFLGVGENFRCALDGLG